MAKRLIDHKNTAALKITSYRLVLLKRQGRISRQQSKCVQEFRPPRCDPVLDAASRPVSRVLGVSLPPASAAPPASSGRQTLLPAGNRQPTQTQQPDNGSLYLSLKPKCKTSV